MDYRKPTKDEEELIQLLVDGSSLIFPADWKDGLLVYPMKDGGMGSLLLIPKEALTQDRKFGRQVAEYHFKDRDGIEVIVSLNVDKSDKLFELDIWKTDYSKLIDISMFKQ